MADLTVVYTDYGISKGMEQGIARAQKENRPIEYRTIGKNTNIPIEEEPLLTEEEYIHRIENK